MKLESERLIVREFDYNDNIDLFEMCSDYDTALMAGWRPHKDIYTSSQVIVNYIYNKETMAIYLKEEKKVIGTISLYKETFRKNTEIRELGFCMNKDYRNQGYMSEAIELVLDYAFRKLKLKLLSCCCQTDNLPSKHLIEKMGFKYEGKIRMYRKLFNKQTCDVYMYSLTDEEFKEGLK